MITMATASERFINADWPSHKHKIERMIYGEKLTNQDILENLNLLGFDASKDQLEAQLGKWGIRRKLPKQKSRAGWQCADHRVTKRKNQGKKSLVIIDGIIHDPDKVDKEISRNKPKYLERLKQGSASPRSPEGMTISVCTPSTIQFASSWPHNLPWLMFLDRLTISISPRTTILTQTTDALLAVLTRGATTIIDRGAGSPNGSSPSSTISQFVAGLQCFMPEAYPGECIRRAQRIMHGSNNERLEQFIVVVLFQLSNNIHINEFTDTWPTILAMIQASGIMGKPLKLKPLQRNGMIDITSMAVAEKLFKVAFKALSCSDAKHPSTIKNETRTLIRWLLSSGQDPNVIISIGKDSFDTGLLVAVQCQEVDLALILLDNGADPDFTPEWSLWTSKRARLPLVAAIDSNDYTRRDDLIEALLNKGTHPDLFDALRAAIHRQDHSTVRLLISHGAIISQSRFNFDMKLSEDDPEALITRFSDWSTVLGCAAGIFPESAALSMVEYLLDQLQKNDNSDELVKVIPAESILTAAAMGHNRVLTLLLDQEIDINTTSHQGVTALHSAAHYGHFDTCLMLLRRDALVDPPHVESDSVPSPLHFAAFRGHLDVVQLLCQWGADINRNISMQAHSWQYHLFKYGVFCCPGCWRISSEDMVNRSMSFCVSPVGAAMHYPHNGSTFRYLVSEGAMIPPGLAHHAAGIRKNIELLSILVENGQDLNERDEHGQTILQATLTMYEENDEVGCLKCREMASFLLHRGVAVTGGEAVQAVLLGYWDLVEQILRQDHDCVAQEHPEMTMIHAALLSQDPEIIWKIFEQSPRAYDPCALCIATLLTYDDFDEMMPVIDRLLENRPPSEIAEDPETLAIGIASWYEDIPLLELLLEELPCSQSMEIRLQDDDILIEADPTIVCSFKPIGVNSKGKEYDGVSPLIFALSSPKARSLLLQHGYEACIGTLIRAVMLDDPAIVRELLQGKQCPIGEGLLSEAVQYGNIETVQTFLEAGEDINDRNFLNNTPLDTAILRGDPSIFQLIFDKNLKVNPGPLQDYLALATACKLGYLSLAKRLIDLGADVDARPSNSPTALEVAAENGRIDMIQLLLSSRVSTAGELPWHYMYAIRFAEENGHYAAAKFLKLHRECIAKDEGIVEMIYQNDEQETGIVNTSPDKAEYIGEVLGANAKLSEPNLDLSMADANEMDCNRGIDGDSEVLFNSSGFHGGMYSDNDMVLGDLGSARGANDGEIGDMMDMMSLNLGGSMNVDEWLTCDL